MVTTPPESWIDIMKPEFKGKVAMVDDPLGNLLIWGTVVTGKPMGTLLTTRGDRSKVIDTLIEIKNNQARAFFASYGDMADAFARNEVTASAIGWEAVAVWAKAKGKTIKYTIPKEGTGMFMDCLCIPKDCPHPDLTYKMINHIISPEPQKIFATEQSAGITNLKTVPMLPPELAQSYNYADLDGFMKKARLQPVPPTEYDGTTATYDDFLQEYAAPAEGLIALQAGAWRDAMERRRATRRRACWRSGRCAAGRRLVFVGAVRRRRSLYFFVISFWSVRARIMRPDFTLQELCRDLHRLWRRRSPTRC